MNKLKVGYGQHTSHQNHIFQPINHLDIFFLPLTRSPLHSYVCTMSERRPTTFCRRDKTVDSEVLRESILGQS